ncbi:MAG TPA: NADH-quinone oxidoreductase subunit L [Pyrinomonadaceae bacterium]|jgi:NADH-quinone oxidoreductase subunit L|nr:NADH-quinone oxidoreductase subunit L [Pyrinomonadaceae bacterium]
MHRLIWLIPLLPLLGALINGLLGRIWRLSEKVVAGVAVGSVALSFLLSVGAVYSYGYGAGAVWPHSYLTGRNGDFRYLWIPGGATEITQGIDARGENQTAINQPSASVLDVEWSYLLDPLSAIFILIITGVGLCIFIFAVGYMHGDAGFDRFFAYLGLFMFSMLVLVMGSNFVMTFVGWEGVGLCSYLLIGYYSDRREAGDAARKAFIANRIGDVGLILAIFAVVAIFGTTQYVAVTEAARTYPMEALGAWGLMSWLALGLFVGACGKSAQIPLFVWLPDAMAGPTPVSALIHAATMVTAGVYLLARTNVIFQHSKTMMLVVAIVGAATALLAATVAVTQTDIKKVLAYSTISQLGLMFLACGVGAFAIGVFHVMTHAFFKALLFLGAGGVIHAMHHEQDLRRMGNLRKYLPRTYLCFLAGWLAICGVIPWSGFWSKDEILWNAAATNAVPGAWLWWLMGTATAFLTAFYMTRLLALTFLGRERFTLWAAGGEADEAHAHGYDEGLEPHDATTSSVGDRPLHEPGAHVAASHPEHGHGYELPKETPAVMWAPLVVLAALATVGGFVGIGPAFQFITGAEHPGGRLNITNWLDPIIWHPANGEFKHQGGIEYAATHGFNLAESLAHALGSHAAAEWTLILISLLAAGGGIGLAWLFYLRRPQLPDVWAARLRPLYLASHYKYWVDDFYELAVTRRVMDAAHAVYTFDSRVIDGVVNNVARLTRLSSVLTGLFDKYVVDGLVGAVALFIKRLSSPLLRRGQTGLMQNYALVMVIGLLLAFSLYFGPEIFRSLKH